MGSQMQRKVEQGTAKQRTAQQSKARQITALIRTGMLSAGNGHQHLGIRVLVGDLREVE